MKVEIEAFVTRFKGQIQEVEPIQDMYSEVTVVFRPYTPEFEYMKKHQSEFSGDSWIKEKYFLPVMETNNNFHIQGEAKDVSFSVGELECRIEKMTVDWKKD